MTALRASSRPVERGLPADLSPTGKLVYLYLAERGAASVEDLKEGLGVPQIRLYPTLECLERRDLVDRTGERFAVPR